MMFAQLLVTFGEKIDVFFAAHETEMGHGADKRLRRLQNAAHLHQVGPKLFGDFEGFVMLTAFETSTDPSSRCGV